MKRNLLPRPIAAAFAALLCLAGGALALAAGPGVHGRVLGHDEKGKLLGVVPGALIEVKNAAGVKVTAAKSDAEGYYKVDLPPGDYAYRITAGGYRNEEAGRGLRIQRSEGYAVFNLALTRGPNDPNRKPPQPPLVALGKLHGRVLERTPRGIVPIPGAKIDLRLAGAKNLVTLFSRTQAQGDQGIGSYAATLAAGSYLAHVSADGFQPLTEVAPLEIKADADPAHDFYLTRQPPDATPGQGIRGSVSVIDAAGRTSLPPVQIEIASLAGGSPVLRLKPAAQGAFTQDLPPGQYRVTASAEGFPAAVSPPAYVFAGRYTRVDLVLHARKLPGLKSRIEVFVFARAADGMQETPLGGAAVSLSKSGPAGGQAQEANTDASGHAIFQVTEEGEFIVEADYPNYKANRVTGQIRLGQPHNVSIELTKDAAPVAGVRLAVTVIDAVTKVPLGGVRLLARRQQQALAEAARGATDANGAAILTVSQDGNYTLLAQLFGYEPGGMQKAIIGRGPHAATLALRPISVGPPNDGPPMVPGPREELFPVRGYVAYRDVTGQLRAVPDARLIWERFKPAAPPVSQFTTSTATGSFSVNFPRGSYQVKVDPPAGFEGVLEQVEITQGMGDKYFLVRRQDRLPPALPAPPAKLVDVQGVVVAAGAGGRFTGVAGADLLFLRGDGSPHTQTEQGGSFALPLAPGAYRVLVRAKGFDPLEARAEIAAGMKPLRYVLGNAPEAPGGATLRVVVMEDGGRLAGMRPVPGAAVQIVQGEKVVASNTTDRGGEFSAPLPPGEYELRVAKAGYGSATDSVQIGARDATKQFFLRRQAVEGPPAKTELTIRVFERMQGPAAVIRPLLRPVAGAQVTIVPQAGPPVAGATGPDGVFAAPLAPGSYSVKVAAQGYEAAGKVVAVGPAGGQADFELTKAGLRRPVDLPPNPLNPPNPRNPRNFPPQPRLPGADADGPNPPATFTVEFRVNPKEPWTELGKFSTAQEAQRALIGALQLKRIPAGAETRISPK